MHVLFATAEFSPLATVGGLASAASGLVAELRAQGVDVTLVMPDYRGIELTDETRFDLDVPAWAGPATVRRGDHPDAGSIHLVNLPGIRRAHPYLQPDGEGWPDNDQRFLAFSQAIAALVRQLHPDVVHLNDWHTAATLAVFVPEDAPPSVLSIHNLAYQGTTIGGWLDRIGPRNAAYEWYGGCNPLSGGIALADAVVAVSPTYASEIVQPANGCGLHDALLARGPALVGIRNGIDTKVWDPTTDRHLVAPISRKQKAAKAATRTALCHQLRLPDDDAPIVVLVTRLVEQKGTDLLPDLVRFLPGIGARLAILGSGERATATALHQAAAAHPDHLAFVEGYDDALSHRLFGGGDLLLMPSRFEPCGLSQMQAMRYGTLPVATDLGGLHDTIIDADARPDGGTGWLAARADAVDILDALHRATRGWKRKNHRRAMQDRGMSVDWSWREPALRHIDLYESIR